MRCLIGNCCLLGFCFLSSDPDHPTEELGPSGRVRREAIIERVELHAVHLAQHVALPDLFARLQWNYRSLASPLAFTLK